MLNFLHLSDLHISTSDADTQFDRDLKIREALLNDLGKDGRNDFDAILVTGDIAFRGHAHEFARAKEWLEELRTKTNSNPEALFVVPGNHDVNRANVAKSTLIWDSHQSLRNPSTSHEDRMRSLQAKLKDPALDFLLALSEYRAFAQEYGCPTICSELAWVQFLNNSKTLEDGTKVRFHGLNSALLSDGEDALANMLLGDFQFNHFDSDPNYVSVVLCHHPHRWLIDGNKANDFFRNQAHLVLCGHEHETRCYREDGSLRLYAGATHPDRRETPYESCYHVLQLSIDTSRGRDLVVRVETRIWQERDKCFVKYSYKGADFHQERISLPARPQQPATTVISDSIKGENSVSSPQEMKTLSMAPDSSTAARRKLIVHFFRIGTLDRFHAAIDAGVWEEGDDAFDGQARWARVFDRAQAQNKLGALWNAVAAKDPTLAGQINPFTPNT